MVEADVGYVEGGKKALLSRLAGSVLMGTMSRDDEDAAKAGLFICSAAFVGLTPSISGLRGEARARVRKAGVDIRRRPNLEPAPLTKRRKIIEGDGEEVVTVAQLKQELAHRDSALTALYKRLDQLIASQHEYTSMVDEEVDALWWAGGDTSWTTGNVWTDIPPLDRGVLAGLEVSSLLRRAPMAPAHSRLLRSVVTGDGAGTAGEFGSVEVAAAIDRNVGAWPKRDEGSPLLRPLASAATIYRRAGGVEDVAREALAGELSLDGSWRKSPLEVAEQLLVERSLEMIA